MTTIDPQRLRELRDAKNLSRRRLALATGGRVSERQLARIEAGTKAHTIRENTLRVLTETLDVSAGVLVGTEPVPAVAGAEGGSAVDPRRLRALREHTTMTRAELADQSGLSERHIARLESSARPVREGTAEALADALRTDLATLAGDGSETYPEPETHSDSVRMEVRVSPQARLAYDLIGYRYGPTRTQILELAPLLIALLAEGCLARRRKRLCEADDAANRLRALGKGASQLYFTPYLVDVDYGLALEEESIKSADLLGDKVRDDDWAWQNFTGDDLNEVTPFADYLCELADDLDVKGIVDFLPTESEATVGFDTIWGAEPYQVCGNALTELTGGTKRARWALAYGDVQLSRMPRDLLHADAKEARVKWLEDRLSDEVRAERESWEDLLEALSAEIMLDKDLQASDKPANTTRGVSP